MATTLTGSTTSLTTLIPITKNLTNVENVNYTRIILDQNYIVEYNYLTKIIAPSLFGFEIMIGVVFSIIAICMLMTIVREKRLFSALLYINIAIANLILIGISVPFILYQFSLQSWIYGQQICKLFVFTRSVSMFVVSFTLLLMSLFRYLIVVKPQMVNIKKYYTISFSMLLVWIISGLINLQTFMVYTVDTFENSDHKMCSYVSPKAAKFNLLIHITIGFCLPMSLSMILQYVTYFKKRKLNTPIDGNVSGKYENNEKIYVQVKNQSKVLFIQTLVYIFTQIPLFLYVAISHINSFDWGMIVMLKSAISVFTLSLIFPFAFCIILIISEDFKFGYYKVLYLANSNLKVAEYQKNETII